MNSSGSSCDHTNTGFDPITRNIYCKDCGKVVAKVKPKPGAPKMMIKGKRK